MLRRPAALAAPLLVLLVACGGGGGGGGGGDDTTPPEVIDVTPGINATGVSTSSTVTVTFSEPVDCATVNSSSLSLRNGSTPVAGTVSCAGAVGTFTPGATLASLTVFTATVTVAVKDRAGNALAEGGSWQFTTGTGGSGTFLMGGTIAASAGQSPDADTADPQMTGNNDTQGAAQPLPSTATVGGFVALTATTGTNAHPADPLDVYRASLGAGQTVTLIPAEGAGTNDVDLCVYDVANPSHSGCSDGPPGTAERLTIDAGAEFYIHVIGFAGASNYTLVLGQGTTSAAAGAVHLGAPLVPGEVLVRFRDGVVSAAASRGGPKDLVAMARSLGLVALGGEFTGGSAHLALPEDPAARARALGALGAKPVSDLGGLLDPTTVARRETWSLVAALRARPDVVSADPNYVYTAQAVPNDAYYPLQWHYPLIQLPQAWDITKGSIQVIVAVADTGQAMEHPDFAGKLVAGYDFISNTANSNDGTGRDADPADPGDATGGAPSSFHGTHVAGTIGANTNDAESGGYNGGVAGVSWNSKIMPVRVLGKGGGTSADIIAGVRWAAGLPVSGVPAAAKKADIINMSLGCQDCYSATEEAEYLNIRNQGVIVIAASGNANTSVKGYPSSYLNVVSVAAVDSLKARAPYSNFNDAVDIAAPGGDTSVDRDGDGYVDGVLSTMLQQDAATPIWTFYQGTSMATPHVAGVVALMKSVCTTLTPAQLDTLISTGAITDDIGAAGRDNQFGHGLVNALKAVQAAQTQCGSSPTEAGIGVDPPSVDFGAGAAGASTQRTITVTKVGSGTLANVTAAVSASAAGWLSVAGPGGAGLGAYTVTANRTGLANGVYTGRVTFTAGTKVVGVDVAMRVGAAAASGGDVGYIYLLAIDPASGEPLGQISGRGTSGTYAFQFSGVPAGDYLLVAGTDADNDGFICDAGEACGAWPTLGVPTPVPLAGNVTNLTFGIAFDAGIGVTSAAADGKAPAEGYRLLRKDAQQGGGVK